MEINFVSESLLKFVTFLVYLLILVGENSSSALGGNEVLVKTKLDGTTQEFGLNVTSCIRLEETQIPGKVTSIVHNGNCVEVHEESDCTGDYITVKPNVPASDKLYKWNFNNQRSWIGKDDESLGAKALSPCRPKCKETNIEYFKQNQDVEVTLYGGVEFNGINRNVTVEGCKVFPKILRNKVQSLISDGSTCLELHAIRDCSGDSIQIPQKTPFNLTSDLGEYGFSYKAIAISFCGYDCSNSNRKKRDEEFYHRDQSSTNEKITLFAQPQFQGFKETIDFNENLCSIVPEAFLKKEPIESIEFDPSRCYLLYESTECNDEKGSIFRLNNIQDAQDLSKAGLRHDIKSISRCSYNPWENLKPCIANHQTTYVSLVVFTMIFAIVFTMITVVLLALVLYLHRQRKCLMKR